MTNVCVCMYAVYIRLMFAICVSLMFAICIKLMHNFIHIGLSGIQYEYVDI